MNTRFWFCAHLYSPKRSMWGVKRLFVIQSIVHSCSLCPFREKRLRILTTPCPSLLPGQQSTELKPDVVLKVPKSISINMVLIGDLNHEKPLLRHTQSDPNVNQGNEKSDTVQDKETVNEQDR